MHTEEEDRGIGVENVLRSVAVMDVVIDDQNPPAPLRPKRIFGGDGDVVEKTESHRPGFFSIVTGGTDEGKRISVGARFTRPFIRAGRSRPYIIQSH
jgi:hypothetical protein